MANKDIRWLQRFTNFKKTMQLLSGAIEIYNAEEEMSDTEKAGLIQFFEMAYELAWNTIKDFYEGQGEVNIQGSRSAFRLAFNRGLIRDGETWLDMVDDRVITVHTYDEEKSKMIINKIVNVHYPLLLQLENRLNIESQQAL